MTDEDEKIKNALMAVALQGTIDKIVLAHRINELENLLAHRESQIAQLVIDQNRPDIEKIAQLVIDQNRPNIEKLAQEDRTIQMPTEEIRGLDRSIQL
jgi:hypothetical protein